MPRRVFVSYSHQQGDWVWDRLVPVLKAAKIGVLIDVERSKGGLALEWQIEEWQKAAEASLLVLTPDYLKSEYCLREMARALARDPSMKEEPARTIPLLREACPLPAEISDPGAFYLDLRSDGHDAPWKKLLDACEAELRPSAPAWLAARDECRTLLGRGASINLEVNDGTHWRELLAHLQSDGFNDLAIVDLHQGRTADRRGLVEELLRQCGSTQAVQPPPADLGDLDRFFSARPSRIALTHFDILGPRQSSYGVDLFAALRDLVTERRLLTLLAVSRSPAVELFPKEHPFSALDLKTVPLRNRG